MFEQLKADLKAETGIEMSTRKAKAGDGTLWQENGKTYFRFCWDKEDRIGIIEGDGEAEKNYVFFLNYLIQNSDKATNRNRDDVFRDVLLGNLESADVFKYMIAYDVPRDKHCFVLAIKTKEINEVLSFLKVINGQNDYAVAIDGNCIGLVVFEDDVTPRDYAIYVHESIRDELNVDTTIGVGNPVKDFFFVSQSNEQAGTALRLSELLKSKSKIHTYRGYMLVKLLEEIPFHALQRYRDECFSPEAEEIFNDEEILDTVEVFCAHSLNIAETARAMYLHRNTVVYRLDKIEKTTGLDIRKYSEATTFRVLSILYKLINQ